MNETNEQLEQAQAEAPGTAQGESPDSTPTPEDEPRAAQDDPAEEYGHFERLSREAEEMKKTFPSFDLRAELKNPKFARMTAPDVGISVEDAYYAVHRAELQAAAMQLAAQTTAEKIATAIRTGGRRPSETGSANTAPFVSTFNYARADKAQREAFKRDLRLRMAKGEKVYPTY